jgi:hypothetical protein
MSASEKIQIKSIASVFVAQTQEIYQLMNVERLDLLAFSEVNLLVMKAKSKDNIKLTHALNITTNDFRNHRLLQAEYAENQMIYFLTLSGNKATILKYSIEDIRFLESFDFLIFQESHPEYAVGIVYLSN